MWLRLGILIISPILFWFAWTVAETGLRIAWLSLTAGSASAYAHNGFLHAVALLAVLLALVLASRHQEIVREKVTRRACRSR